MLTGQQYIRLKNPGQYLEEEEDDEESRVLFVIFIVILLLSHFVSWNRCGT